MPSDTSKAAAILSPWARGVIPGCAVIIEQINLDPDTGLATEATYYQARFHFPTHSLKQEDVYPTFARPRAEGVTVKLIPHPVNTCWFPAWLVNGYLVYSLPAEWPAAGTCGEVPDPGTPTAPVPGGGVEDTPEPSPIILRRTRPLPGPSPLTAIMLNENETVRQAFRTWLGVQ